MGKFNLVFLVDLIFFLDKNHCLYKWAYWRIIEDARQSIDFPSQLEDTVERERKILDMMIWEMEWFDGRRHTKED